MLRRREGSRFWGRRVVAGHQMLPGSVCLRQRNVSRQSRREKLSLLPCAMRSLLRVSATMRGIFVFLPVTEGVCAFSRTKIGFAARHIE